MSKIVPQGRVVVAYGNLSEAALREHYEPQLVIYHIAQTMKRSSGGCGVPKLALIDELVALRLFTSRAHIRHLLERGKGVLWTIKCDRVWLFGIERIARTLGARRANAHRHMIHTNQLRSSAGRRAALLGATLPIDRPIRQATIRAHTGVSPRTQRRYRHSGAFDAKRQDADVTTAACAPSTWTRPDWAKDHAEYGVYIKGVRLMKRLPNIYTPKGERFRRGRRSKQMFAARPLTLLAEGTLTAPLVYFDSTSKWRKPRSRPTLGTPAGAECAYPFNFAYIRAGKEWEAYAC